MTKFIYLYSGGKYPETPEEGKAVMEAWGAWMGGLGDKLVDGGSAFGDKTHLGDGKETPVNGFSVVEADSLEGAKKLAAKHPHLDAGGSIEVATFLDM